MQPIAAEPEADIHPCPCTPDGCSPPLHLRTYPDSVEQPLLNDIDTLHLHHSDNICVIRTATRNLNRNSLWIDAANLWIS